MRYQDDMDDDLKSISDEMLELFAYQEQPVPFFYVHFIRLLVYLYLPLFSYALATTLSYDPSFFFFNMIIGIVVVIAYNIYVIGFHCLGLALADPFGNDLVDFDLYRIISTTRHMSHEITLG